MKAKEFIPASKPRNFVAKNQKTAGAGAHKDKKRAEKQGDVKHKGKQYDEGRLGVAGRSPSPEEKKKQDDYRNSPGMKKFMFQGLTIEFTPDELKIYRGGDLIHSKSGNFKDPTKLQVNSAKVIASKLVDKIKQQDMSERIRDPEDWDEGNTEPPNNMAVYINGKLWKVFQGYGTYADDAREMQQYYKLQDWARKKSQQTGKKWEVSRTGAPATESMEEGWKEKLAAAGLAGAMALGAGNAAARVSGDEDPGINRLTGKPIATQVAPSDTAKKDVVPLSSRYDSKYQGSPEAYTIQVDGKLYKFAGRTIDAPGDGEKIKVPAAAIGIRGLAPVTVELGKDGTYYQASSN